MPNEVSEWYKSFAAGGSDPIEETITGPFADVASAIVEDQNKEADRIEGDPEASQRLKELLGPPASSPATESALDTTLHGERKVKGSPEASQRLKELLGPPPAAKLQLGELATLSDDEKAAKQKATGREPTGIFSGIIDVLSRAQYAEVAMIDEIAKGELSIKAIGNTLKRGIQEFVTPHDRLSYTDLIQKYNPEFAKENPVATVIAGTAMDIAFDPTTWLSFGVGGAGKAVKVASKTGETLFLTSKGATKLKKLTTVSQKYISEELITDAARFNWAEEKIAKMAMTDPSLTFKKGFQIHAQVPFQGKHVATILSPAAAKNFADATGLTAMKNATKLFASKNMVLQSIKGTFRQVDKLPPKYMKLANEFLSVAENASEEVIKATAKMFKGLDKQGAMKIGRAAHGISDELMQLSRNVPQELSKLRGGTKAALREEQVTAGAKLAWAEEMIHKQTMASGQAGRISEDVMEQVQRKWFAAEKLGEKEINVYAQMRHSLSEIKQQEHQMGILIGEVAEYFPRYYTNIIKPTDATGEFYTAKRFTARLASSKARVLDGVKDAEAIGLKPEWNAVKVLSVRASASRKAIAKKRFDVALEDLVKAEKFDPKTAALIKRDAREIGDSIHPNFDKEWMNALVNSHDFIINSVFRPSATILKPAFTAFQILSNTVQMMWAGGFRSGARAGAGVAKNIAENVGSGFGQKYWESMRKTLWNIDPKNPKLDSAMILKHLDDPSRLKSSRITSDIGTSYTGEEVAIMVKDMRIAQGTSVLGVPGMKKTAMGELRRTNAVAVISDKTGVSEGFLDFAAGAASYWNWPRMVEDMARTNFFMTALRQGHSPHEAMRLVSKGLYDYTGGLSKFERQWIRRIIPFYSFTRFTLPLAVDMVATKPGRLLNTARGMKGFFAAWNKLQGGEQLNEAERHSIPGWILEQASTFAKFGLDGRAHFNAFTNWTPLDAVNFLEPGDSERSGMEKTVQKTILSMMSPVIKLPLEQVMNKNFFTGRTIKDVYNVKDRLGEAGTIWRAADTVIPDAAKEMMGWEMATDMRTGKQNVYINPYLTHYATGIAPVLNSFIRMFDADLSPTEKAMVTIANVATYKIDMQQAHKRTVNGRKAAMAEKKREIKYLISKGMDGAAEESMYELQQLMRDIRGDAEEETEAPRGPTHMPKKGL